MSEIKVIMSCNIHSHKPRTIPKRWRLWIELLKAFPSGFAKQQSWLGRWRCEVFAAVMFHAASDAFSASPTLHLVNCVRFFHVLFQLPIGYETRDAMEKNVIGNLSNATEVMGNLRSIPAEQVQVQSSLHLSLRMFLVFQLRGALKNRTCLRAFRFVEALSGSRWRHEASRSQETVWFGIFKCSTMSTILEYNVNSSQASVPIVVIIP